MKHLIPHFIVQQNELAATYGRFNAYTIFLDMAGFTTLTESLCEEDEHEGVELMSQILNEIFEPLVRTVYQKNGFIPYFAGDAFTAIFNDDNVAPEELALTVLKMQQDFATHNYKHKEQELPIRLKIGLAYGQVEWGIIGEQHKGFYFKGEAIDHCANSEHHALENEVIAHQSFIKHCDTTHPEFKTIAINDNYFKITSSFTQASSNLVTTPSFSYESLAPFYPKSVIFYENEGEFRDVVSVFIAFEDTDDHRLFHQFATIIREEFYNFSGYFKEIDFGDKGGLIVGFFGVPVTYGDNIERALEFVLSLRNKLIDIPLQYKIGLTEGSAYTGIIGGEEKCQYAVVGASVNLAARFMVYADWGEVLIGKNIQKTKGYHFIHKGDFDYKGFEEPVPTFYLKGKLQQGRAALFEGEMVGRQGELNILSQFVNPLLQGNFSGVAILYGEAGIGKSRLTFELKKRLFQQGNIGWWVCQADQIFQKPFNPFIYLLNNVFQQSLEKNQEENKKVFEKRFEHFVQECQAHTDRHPELVHIIKELQRTKTVIAARLGLSYRDSLWTQLDGKGKYQNTISAFIHLLKAKACLAPLVLKIEDGHWFDENTKSLLSEIILNMQDYPLFILITSRYNESDASKPYFFNEEITQKISVLEIDLNILSADAIEEFAVKRLDGKISSSLKKLLVRTSSGNPFYTEQILEYFIESGVLTQKESIWYVKDENIKLSSSINAVLMARIDRLSDLVKETVKAAAVIGREFEVKILGEVMKTQRSFTKTNSNAKHLLQEQITSAEKGQIWKAINEIRYIFKHSLLREAVYDMQIRARLRELHQLIAEAIERLYAEQIENRYADLAFHYEQAGMTAKTNEYLEKAGDYAKENYDNAKAIYYYDKLAANLDHIQEQSTYIKTLLKKASILRMQGNWNESERVLHNALALASSSSDMLLIGRANNDLGRLLLLKGDYTQANQYLQIAATFFEDINDEIGRSKVYGNLGDVFFRQGEYEKAKDYFKESLNIKSEGNFNIVSNLGLALMNQGEYEEAIQNMQPHLTHYEQNGNKLGIANISIFLGIVYFEKGDYDAAMDCYQKGLQQCEELGDKFLMAIALGSMGKLLVQKGNLDTAQELYEKDLRICRELGDKQGTSITLGLLGDLYLEQGKFSLAIQHLQEQLEISENLHYQKGIASAWGSIGNAYYFQADYEKAKNAYQKGIAISEEINNKRLLIILLVKMIEISLETDDDKAIIKQLSLQADTIADEIGNEELIYITSVKRSQAKLKYGNTQEALLELEQLLDTAQASLEKAETLFVLATSKHTRANIFKEKALEYYRNIYHKRPTFSLRRRIDFLNTL